MGWGHRAGVVARESTAGSHRLVSHIEKGDLQSVLRKQHSMLLMEVLPGPTGVTIIHVMSVHIY